MGKISKILLTFVVISFCLFLSPIIVAHAAGKPPIDVDGTGGNIDVGGGSGSVSGYYEHPYWFLVPETGTDSLVLDVYVAIAYENGSSVYSSRVKDYKSSECPIVKPLKGASNKAKFNGLSIYDESSSYGTLCTIEGRSKVTWDNYAERLNRINEIPEDNAITGEDVVAAVDEWLSSRVVNDTWSNSCVWYDKGAGSKLFTIDLSTFFDDYTPPDPPEPESTYEVDEQVEYKWVLSSLKIKTWGSTFYPSGTVTDYDSATDFTATDSKYNDLSDLEEAWNGVDDITLEYEEPYAVNTKHKATALYKRIKRVRTRYKISYKVWYAISWDDHGNPDDWDYYWDYYWSQWSDWSYSVASKKKIKKTTTENNDIYMPEYTMYNWLDLTTEEFTHDSPLSAAKSIIPTDFKDASNYNDINLNVTMKTYKDKNKIYTLLSDNNPKKLELKFTGMFGIPAMSTTRLDGAGSEYLIDCAFYYGAQKNKQTTDQLISVQQISPSSKEETLSREKITYTGQSSIDFKVLFRSIKYKTYWIGDSEKSNFWYVGFKKAAVNKLGTKYSTTALGESKSVTTTVTALQNDLDLSATFLQPVLYGQIDVMDAAGN